MTVICHVCIAALRGYNSRMFSNIRLTLFCYLNLAGITKG
jgi:hypothetical protein